MAIEIKVPALGESVTEATVGQWFKQPGDAVAVDEPLVELETDKVTVEVPAPSAGVLAAIKVPQGGTVAVGTVLGGDSGDGDGRAAWRGDLDRRDGVDRGRPRRGRPHTGSRGKALRGGHPGALEEPRVPERAGHRDGPPPFIDRIALTPGGIEP